MGYVKEKYTKDYFLGSTDKETNEAYGAAGAESFKSGRVDKRYTRYLTFLNLKDKEVLDIGCGRGDVVHYCIKRGAKWFLALILATMQSILLRISTLVIPTLN